MTESESVALPFGDSPMSHHLTYYTRSISKMQYPNLNFFKKLSKPLFLNRNYKIEKDRRAADAQRILLLPEEPLLYTSKVNSP